MSAAASEVVRPSSATALASGARTDRAEVLAAPPPEGSAASWWHDAIQEIVAAELARVDALGRVDPLERIERSRARRAELYLDIVLACMSADCAERGRQSALALLGEALAEVRRR